MFKFYTMSISDRKDKRIPGQNTMMPPYEAAKASNVLNYEV